MMPPTLNRFPSGPATISPYHQQFPSHGQHSTTHPPPLTANPSYLNPNSQINAFTANGNLLSLAGGLNSGGAFGVGVGVGNESGLASHAARMSFAHAGNLQQQQQQHAQQQSHVLGEHQTRSQAKSRIREVWKHNLHEEMATLRDLVDKYPYIAMVRNKCSARG